MFDEEVFRDFEQILFLSLSFLQLVKYLSNEFPTLNELLSIPLVVLKHVILFLRPSGNMLHIIHFFHYAMSNIDFRN